MNNLKGYDSAQLLTQPDTLSGQTSKSALRPGPVVPRKSKMGQLSCWPKRDHVCGYRCVLQVLVHFRVLPGPDSTHEKGGAQGVAGREETREIRPHAAQPGRMQLVS